MQLPRFLDSDKNKHSSLYHRITNSKNIFTSEDNPFKLLSSGIKLYQIIKLFMVLHTAL